jgi:phage baseplate assembly protein W
MAKEFLGRGWRSPVDVDRTGGVSLSALDENIRESIMIILSTAPGERVMRPYFGCQIHDLVFAPSTPNTAGLAAHYCEEALRKWEPRVEDVKAWAKPAPGEPNKLLIDISYKVSSTDSERNLVYPFYLRRPEEGKR